MFSGESDWASAQRPSPSSSPLRVIRILARRDLEEAGSAARAEASVGREAVSADPAVGQGDPADRWDGAVGRVVQADPEDRAAPASSGR